MWMRTTTWHIASRNSTRFSTQLSACVHTDTLLVHIHNEPALHAQYSGVWRGDQSLTPGLCSLSASRKLRAAHQIDGVCLAHLATLDGFRLSQCRLAERTPADFCRQARRTGRSAWLGAYAGGIQEPGT